MKMNSATKKIAVIKRKKKQRKKKNDRNLSTTKQFHTRRHIEIPLHVIVVRIHLFLFAFRFILLRSFHVYEV